MYQNYQLFPQNRLRTHSQREDIVPPSLWISLFLIFSLRLEAKLKAIIIQQKCLWGNQDQSWGSWVLLVFIRTFFFFFFYSAWLMEEETETTEGGKGERKKSHLTLHNQKCGEWWWKRLLSVNFSFASVGQTKSYNLHSLLCFSSNSLGVNDKQVTHWSLKLNTICLLSLAGINTKINRMKKQSAVVFKAKQRLGALEPYKIRQSNFSFSKWGGSLESWTQGQRSPGKLSSGAGSKFRYSWGFRVQGSSFRIKKIIWVLFCVALGAIKGAPPIYWSPKLED